MGQINGTLIIQKEGFISSLHEGYPVDKDDKNATGSQYVYLATGGRVRELCQNDVTLINLWRNCDIREMQMRFGIDANNPRNKQEIYDNTNNCALRELLVRGKINLILLVNSTGGKPRGYYEIEDLGEKIRAQGGKVTTFGGMHMHSAAARLWMLGDNQGQRFCLNQSTLMFHLKSTVVAQGGTKKEQEWELMQQYLGEHVSKQFSPKLKRKCRYALMHDDEHPDRPILFAGEEIQEAGLGIIARTNADLRRICSREIGAELNFGYGVYHFFDRYCG